MRHAALSVVLGLALISPLRAGDPGSAAKVAVSTDGKVFVTFGAKERGVFVLDKGAPTPLVPSLNATALATYQGWVVVAEQDRIVRFDRKGRADMIVPARAFPVPASALTSLAVDAESGTIYAGHAATAERPATIYRITLKGAVDAVVDRRLAAQIAAPGALLMDGASHLLIGDRDRLYRLRLADRRLETLAEGLGDINALAWDRFGRLFVSSWSDGLHVIPRPGERPVRMTVSEGASALALAPDNRSLLVATLRGDVVNASTDIPGQPVDVSPLPLETEVAFPKLQWEDWRGEDDAGKIIPLRPIFLTHAGDGSNRVFAATQLGAVHVFPNDQQATQARIFLDLRDRVRYLDNQNEEGFLGLAFHPRYKENGELFAFYTRKKAKHPRTNVVSRFRVRKDDPNRADPNSEEELLRIERPFWNHDGGTIAFGPDGYLYIALGDGGAANDPFDNAQNLGTLLGSVLRIDVDRKEGQRPYAIPKDNPFVQTPDAQPEIWAYGLRNVWRFSFDKKTGLCWAADVGQNLYEEINLLTAGGNYGWNRREGLHPFGARGSGPSKEYIDPIWEYHHDIGRSITGGFVYRGSRVPELEGHYLYADYVTGRLWAMRYDEKAGRVVANRPIRDKSLPIMSFGEDERGDVYLLTTSASGRGLLRFIPSKR